jgi:threonine aldolase
MFDDLKFKTSLGSDNHSGVHPEIMKAILAANRGHAHAYGMDELCQKTDLEFKRIFGPEVEAQYVFTGTAANVLCMSTSLKSFEAVICSSEAHLHLDECGAPEKFLGCKVWTIESDDGKFHPEQCMPKLQRMGDQHHSQPRLVTLTQPTELGVCYSLAELQKWRKFTREKNLMLHLDGARLANAAATLNCTLRELTTELGADVVSFGGTKSGMLGAEAVLLISPLAKANFKFYRKQAMQLSSKTRFLAAQFYAYLKDDLWLSIAKHTTGHAKKLEQALLKIPEITLPYPVQSNAVFARVPKEWIHPLREKFFFYVWDAEHNLCRWMISFDWTDELTEEWISHIEGVKKCFPVK